MNSVLTYIFGDKELLREPTYVDNDVEYICVTDNPNLKSTVWKCIYHPLDEFKSVRLKLAYVKTHPFEFVNGDTVCIIDGAIRPERSLNPLFNRCSSGILMKLHPVRNTLADELSAWQTYRNLSSTAAEKYCALAYFVRGNLNKGPLYESCVMVWKKCERVIQFGECVFDSMQKMSTAENVFQSNQLVMSLLLQTVFNDIGVNTIDQAKFFTHYRHNSTKIRTEYIGDDVSLGKPNIIVRRPNNYLCNNITLLSANYNTPMLTLCMLKTFVKHTNGSIPMCVIDNSTQNALPSSDNPKLTIIDNTNYKHTKNYGQVSANHAASIEYALGQIHTRYVLLVDSDVLFKRSIVDLLNTPCNLFDAAGECCHEAGVVGERLLPYCCIIDLDKMKQDKIHYFDRQRIMCDSIGTPYSSTYKPHESDHVYFDTGSSFLSDIRQKRWKICQFSVEQYIYHLKGGSLHKEKYTLSDWVTIGNQIMANKLTD